jgi:hypothetical protein
MVCGAHEVLAHDMCCSWYVVLMRSWFMVCGAHDMLCSWYAVLMVCGAHEVLAYGSGAHAM